MRFDPKHPPRKFTVGNTVPIEMNDCGSMNLEPDEQITFTTDDGAEYDVARKQWGFYATPSLNGRLASFDLRCVLVRNQVTGRYFILLVQRGHEKKFEDYLVQEHCKIVTWLDNTQTLDRLRSFCGRLEEGTLPDHGN